MKTRTVGAVKGKRPELKLDEAPSNATSDRNAQLIHVAAWILTASLVGGGLYWGVMLVNAGFNHGQIQWGPAVGGAAAIGISIFLARSLAWMCYFAAIMYAFKTQGYDSLERLCRSALKNWKVFPGGAATAALMLVQNLVSRGKFDEAIAIGEQQWEMHGQNPKFNESLAPMYTALGMAYQVKGEPKESIKWTDRGLEALQRSLDELVNKKNWQAKIAGPQGIEWAKQLRMQLAVASFNNASNYFNQMNYRQAKQLFKQSLDYCNQSADFPEKGEIMRVSREQLSRLKHS
jgi:tetratricopeptide (TPR) repeat protein